jgi:hypothetical protein
MTGELASHLTSDEARSLTDRIKSAVEDIWQLIREAYTERAWSVLGYDSWDAYCSAEFGTSRLRLPREDRSGVVGSLREAGLSTRAIASATGLGESTVRRDLATAPFGAVQDRIVGLDNKERPASRPASTPPPIRTPHPHAEEDARRDQELEAEMEGTDTRFRLNFARAMARADDVWQFDLDRIGELYAADFDTALRPWLEEMTSWCEHVTGAARQHRNGLRIVEGGRS